MKVMKRWRLGLGALAVLVIAVIAVRLLLPAHTLQEFLFEQLESRTGLKATAEEASLRILWPVGLRLKGLELSTGENPRPGMPRIEGHVEEVLATADLLSLLRRKPQVQEIRLKRPDLRVWMPKAAPTAPAGEGDAGGSSGSPKASLPPALALALMSVEEGTFTLHPASGGTVILRGLDQRVRARLLEDGSFTGRLEGKLASLSGGDPPFVLSSLHLKARVQGNLQPLRVRIEIAEGSIQGLTVQGPVEIRQDTEGRRLESELQWTLPLPAARKLVDASASVPPGVEWEYRELQGLLRAQGLLPPSGASSRQWLDLVSVDASLSGLQLAGLGRSSLVEGGIELRQRGNVLTVSTEKLSLPGAAFHGSLELPVLGAGQLQGRMEGRVDAGAVEELLRSIWTELPQQMTQGAPPVDKWPGVSGQLDTVLDLSLPWPMAGEIPPSALRSKWSIRRIAILGSQMPDSLVLQGGEIQTRGTEVQLTAVRFRGPGLQGEFGGRWENPPEGPRFLGSAAFSVIDLDRLRARPPSRHAAWLPGWWRPSTAWALPAPAAFPAPPVDLSAEVGWRCERLLGRGYELHGVRGELRLERRVLELRDMEGAFGDGRVQGRATIDWTTATPTWSVKVKGKDLPSGTILAPVAPRLAAALSTLLRGEFTLEGPLGGAGTEIRSQLSGEGVLFGSAGKLLTAELLGKSLSSLPAGAAERLREIPFREFLARLRFEQGRAQFDEILLKGETQVRANGWVGFDGKVDYHLEVKLPPGETLDLGSLTPLVEFLRTADGRITLPVRVQGAAGHPRISLELTRARQHMEDSTRESLQDKLRGLLKNLGKKKEGGGGGGRLDTPQG